METERIYVISGGDVSVKTHHEGSFKVTDLVREFAKRSTGMSEYEELDINASHPHSLDIVINLVSTGYGNVTIEHFANIARTDTDWRRKWRQENYYDTLYANRGKERVAKLTLVKDYEDEHEIHLAWTVNEGQASKDELEELFSRMNRAKIFNGLTILK